MSLKTTSGGSRTSDVSRVPFERDFRNALGAFASGVTVVTYGDGEDFRGATVNSFTSVSMDPPLVLVSFRREAKAAGKLHDRPFAINVLREGQESLAMHFAGRPNLSPEDIGWEADGLAPRLSDSLAHFVCTPWNQYDGGDHVLILGQVDSFQHHDEHEPLVFYRGGWKALATHSPQTF